MNKITTAVFFFLTTHVSIAQGFNLLGEIDQTTQKINSWLPTVFMILSVVAFLGGVYTYFIQKNGLTTLLLAMVLIATLSIAVIV